MDTRRRPNVLLIICDDLAYGDLACHGNPHTSTPTLDRLHSESTRLTRYCSGPLCTPARAALMTGRHPYRTGAIDTYCGRSMLHHDEATLAGLLRDVGYATCLSGKWHLGDCHPMRPIDKGFVEMLMHHGGGLRQPGCPGHWDDPPRDSYFNPTLSHNGTLEQRDGYCTDIFADHCIDFIRRHADQPWFAYLATNAPHSPFEVDEAQARPYLDAGLPEKIARLYAMVDNIDANVGRVLGAIDALGLTDETIVLFTSDHGPCGSANVDGRPRFNAGLRGIKGRMYEGGIRTPSFWRWPGRFAAGREIDRIANPIDVLPTLGAACGFAPSEDRSIDGVNLLPMLAGEAGEAEPRTIPMQWHRGDVPVRHRNAVVIGQRFKWYRPDENQPAELYDIEADPGETRDLADEHPEVVRKLADEYDRWFDDVCGTRPNNFDVPRIVVGSDAEPTTLLSRQDWRVIGDDGWSDGHRGQWVVRFDRGGRYRFAVEMPPGDGPVLLRVGESVHEIADQAIDLPRDAGETTIEAWRGDGDARQAARYVTVGPAEPA